MFKKSLLFLMNVVFALSFSGCTLPEAPKAASQLTVQQVRTENDGSQTAPKKFRILNVMSYNSPWEWTDTQLAGFKDALADLDADFRVFQMDAKNQSSDEAKEKMGEKACEIIDSWKPDLVYCSDDEAQQFVTSHYLNTDLPFVFSAVNKNPGEYGLTDSKNVTGVLEIEHFAESVELFRKIVPNAKKIAVIFDDSSIWGDVKKRIQAKAEKMPDVQFVYPDAVCTYKQYQELVRLYGTSVDGICLVGVFGFKDEQGSNVPYREVLQWTAENSKIPDFSFWADRISYGTLCSVTVSGYEQGLAAGKIAYGILAEGKSPASFSITATNKGQPVINLQRAKALGLKIDINTLLSSRVINKYAWEK